MKEKRALEGKRWKRGDNMRGENIAREDNTRRETRRLHRKREDRKRRQYKRGDEGKRKQKHMWDVEMLEEHD